MSKMPECFFFSKFGEYVKIVFFMIGSNLVFADLGKKSDFECFIFLFFQ